MRLGEILLIAIGMAMDAAAVSAGIGAGRTLKGRRPLFRLAFHFGLFQMLMPVLGWFAGLGIAGLISQVDHWLALVLLAIVGVRMIRSGIGSGEDHYGIDPSRGGLLVMLSLATSVDAFAIGLSLAMIGVDIVVPAVVIGVVTSGLSLAALKVGHRLGQLVGKRMEVLGGLVLIGIGVKVVIEHLAGAAG